MKRIFYAAMLVILSSIVVCGQTTYYFRGGAVNTLTNWQTTRSGASGTAATTFANAADTWDFNETSGNISAWTVAGNITNTKNGGGAVGLSTLTLDAGASFSVGGAITATNLAFTLGSGSTFTYSGANQTVIALTYQNLTLSGSGTKTAGGSIIVNGTLANGVILNMGVNDLGGASLTTTGSGSLRTQSTSASSLPTGRTWEFSVIMDGAAQTIPGGTYSNLEIAGTGNKTLAGNATVNGTLTLTANKLNTNTNTLTLNNAIAANQISGGSATSYVYSSGAGRLRRNNLSTGSVHVFPIGTANYYLRADIDPLDATSDFAVSAFEGLTQDGTPTGTPFTNKNPVVDAVWNIDRPTGTGDASVTLRWDAALEGSAFSTFGNSEIGISHYEFGNWQSAIGVGNNSSNVAIAAFSSFSPFAVGKTGTILPITFGNIKAYEKQRGVQIDWSVLADQSVSDYIVERSADARTFSKIGTVASRQSQLSNQYDYFDAAPLPGTGYYRIRSVQKDGSTTLSTVLRINLNKTNKEVVLYPNPIKGNVLSLLSSNLAKGNYTVRMYNAGGQEMMQLRFDHSGGAINQTISLPRAIHPGVYQVQLDNEGSRVMSKKLMVQ